VDPSLSWRDIAWALATLCMAIGGVFMTNMNRLLGRTIDRLNELERNYVTREELQKTFEQMRQDRMAMHLENRDSLRRIEDMLGGELEKLRS